MFELGDRVEMLDNTISDGYAIPNGATGTVIAVTSTDINDVYIAWDDDYDETYRCHPDECQLDEFEDWQNTWWCSAEALGIIDKAGGTRHIDPITRKIEYLYKKQENQQWRKAKASSSDTSHARSAEVETTWVSGQTDTATVSVAGMLYGRQSWNVREQEEAIDRIMERIREELRRTSAR